MFKATPSSNVVAVYKPTYKDRWERIHLYAHVLKACDRPFGECYVCRAVMESIQQLAAEALAELKP